ncbi:piggyBac transposable element-derived protein 4-like [Saccostrea echinata]|uniref:piggyBac transposable element-derived protein 4-like n=1 Tax=Saccostrea echinata TaxID=191078 RepID=UPI002A7ED03F|nr:piggyBac transposable element-derived protein 4-like [Saccostrea echinata]
MGGVDLGDQLLTQYEHQFRSLKLWKKILFSFFMMAAVNAYICYKSSFVIQKKMDHLQFQKEIIKGLLGNFREGRLRRGRLGVQRCARLSAKHFIDWIPEKKRMKCAVCSGKRGNFAGTRIRTWCPDCSVGLCVGNCFRKFHTLINYEE